MHNGMQYDSIQDTLILQTVSAVKQYIVPLSMKNLLHAMQPFVKIL